MDVTQKARGLVASAVGVAARVLPHRGGGAQQTLTLARPAAEVLDAWRDAGVVSRLMGEVGSAEATDARRWTFTLARGGSVEAELVDVDGGLEFREPGGPRPAQQPVSGAEDDTESGRTGEQPAAAPEEEPLLRITTRPAPREEGTEVTCRVATRLSAGVGAVPFTLLYRLRALLLTGEIPALEPQPAAREGGR